MRHVQCWFTDLLYVFNIMFLLSMTTLVRQKYSVTVCLKCSVLSAWPIIFLFVIVDVASPTSSSFPVPACLEQRWKWVCILLLVVLAKTIPCLVNYSKFLFLTAEVRQHLLNLSDCRQSKPVLPAHPGQHLYNTKHFLVSVACKDGTFFKKLAGGTDMSSMASFIVLS